MTALRKKIFVDLHASDTVTKYDNYTGAETKVTVVLFFYLPEGSNLR